MVKASGSNLPILKQQLERNLLFLNQHESWFSGVLLDGPELSCWVKLLVATGNIRYMLNRNPIL